MDLHGLRLIIATDCPGLRLSHGSMWRVIDVAPIGASVRLGIKSEIEPRTVVL